MIRNYDAARGDRRALAQAAIVALRSLSSLF